MKDEVVATVELGELHEVLTGPRTGYICPSLNFRCPFFKKGDVDPGAVMIPKQCDGKLQGPLPVCDPPRNSAVRCWARGETNVSILALRARMRVSTEFA